MGLDVWWAQCVEGDLAGAGQGKLEGLRTVERERRRDPWVRPVCRDAATTAHKGAEHEAIWNKVTSAAASAHLSDNTQCDTPSGTLREQAVGGAARHSAHTTKYTARIAPDYVRASSHTTSTSHGRSGHSIARRTTTAATSAPDAAITVGQVDWATSTVTAAAVVEAAATRAVSMGAGRVGSRRHA